MKPVDFRNRINNTKHTARLEAMISGANPCFPNIGSQLGLQMHGGGGGNTGISTDSPEIDPTISSLLQGTRSLSSVNYGHTDVDHGRHHEYHLSSLLDSLSVIKDKVHQIQSLLNFLMSPTTSHPHTDHHHHHHQQQQNHGDQQQLPNQPVSSSFSTSPSIGLASNMGMLIQEIVVTASSMLFNCQQMSLSTGPSATTITTPIENNAARQSHQLISSSGCTAATMIAIATAAVAAPGDRGAPYLSSFNQGTTGHDNIYWRTDSHNHIPSSSYHNCNGGSGNDDDNYPNCMSASMFDDDSKLIIDTTSGAAKQNTQPAEKLCPPRSSESLLPQNHQLPPPSSSMLRDNGYDIVEVDAEDLLAKYTHFCRVCGKGFKRDANLRMHMRAHGDEYKSNAALINPLKKMKSLISDSAAPTTAATPEGDANHNNSSSNYNYYYKDHGSSSKMVYSSPSIDQLPSVPRKVYSCPQEGCRWNKKHAKFQPLKSMICVKNHYKRSHCPKMYVCKRCNRKQFSVLSDLKTHEKHCGDRRWQCSCGTTFSRKDKLMGHVALFLGHTPMVPNTLAQPQATKPT